jgi:hypothetical protein
LKRRHLIQVRVNDRELEELLARTRGAMPLARYCYERVLAP